MEGRGDGAERTDERVKLIVASLDAIALAVFGTAFVLPPVLLSWGPWASMSAALALHLGAHAVLQFLRSEE